MSNGRGHSQLTQSSNGPKWNEVASEDLGLELLNVATGGATTDNAYIKGGTGADSTIPVPSATDQIANFLKNTDGPRKHDIFVQWIGANDILFDNTANPEKVAQLIKANIDLLRQHGMSSCPSCPSQRKKERKERELAQRNKMLTYLGGLRRPHRPARQLLRHQHRPGHVQLGILLHGQRQELQR